ncbi:hypothetical protein GQX74_006026 [Glossina fuscipes]|nr:hypothetical protein GQX74_006026 [Glossina fuscipes]
MADCLSFHDVLSRLLREFPDLWRSHGELTKRPEKELSRRTHYCVYLWYAQELGYMRAADAMSKLMEEEGFGGSEEGILRNMFNKLFKSVVILWIIVCLGYQAVAAITDELNRVKTSSSSNKQDNHVADDSGLPTAPITSRRR